MTRRYAVIGNPIAHSLSPQMHAAWIEDHKLDATYVRHLFDGDESAFVTFAKTRPFDGANVTVPFKSAARAAADRSDSADDVANVLTWTATGEIIAANTDGDGFLRALDEGAPDWRRNVKTVLIIGAGGGAAGIARALADSRRMLTIANRTPEHARALAETFGARAAPWSDLPKEFATADLIVQTTTLGMTSAASPAWPIEQCQPTAIIVDIVYRPLETPLLKAARARGLTAIDGLGMLIHQGALAFEIWFGVKPDTKKARERLTKILGEQP